jgi:predicted ABC-type ATPase
MPRILILAGPNGAGKTTFASNYLRDEPGLRFINADEIRRKYVVPPGEGDLDRHAAREMLRQVRKLVENRQDFAFETTLATLSYAQRIPTWQRSGYGVALIYLRLANADESVQRIQRRVAAGGHGVPESIVRRRFSRSTEYFERLYKQLVDEWYIWDSLEGTFRLADAGSQR